MKNICHANSNQYIATGVPILKSGKIDFRAKKITRGRNTKYIHTYLLSYCREGHYMVTKKVNPLRRHALLNVYESNSRTEKCVKQKLI